jgi:hypothetical protein
LIDPERSPIFVVGTGRSGTTLLRFMLSAHPRIYLTHEASFYVWESLLPKREFPEAFFETHSFRWLRVDPARVRARLTGSSTSGDAFSAVMREKASQYGRVRWGDKTPGHTHFLKRIFEDFPEAKVVHIVRDPRSTVLSLCRMPWASRSPYANAVYCEIDWKRAAPFRERMLQIRLEDLLAKPRETMGRVLEHVGEPWDDAVLDHPAHIPAKDDMPPYPWLEVAARARGAPEQGWPGLTPVQIRMIERLTQRTMKGAAYAPAELAAKVSLPAVWRAGLGEVPESLRHLMTYYRHTRAITAERDFTGEALALFRLINPEAWARYPGFEMPVAPALPSVSRSERPPVPRMGGADLQS